jgi:DNA repair protein RadC
LDTAKDILRKNRTKKPKLDGPFMVSSYVRANVDIEHQEKFMVLSLDSKNRLIRMHVVSIGTVDSTIVHPRDVFRNAIADNARSVILVHNHPSGDPSPSPEDTSVTRRLADASDILGIPILDHVIIGDGEEYSFHEQGFNFRKG